MNYISLTHLRNALSEEVLISLVNDEGLTVSLLDENDPAQTTLIARINSTISTASAMIDGYCGMKYSTPFTSLPPLLEDIAVQIALYRLYLRRGDEGIPQPRIDAYSDALKKLQGISDSSISLGLNPAPLNGKRGNAVTSSETYTRTFDKKSLHSL